MNRRPADFWRILPHCVVAMLAAVAISVVPISTVAISTVAISAEQGVGRPEQTKKLAELLEARLKTADEALQATLAKRENRRLPVTQILLVEQKHFNAHLEAARTPAEKLAAFKRHLKTLEEFEAQLEKLYLTAGLGGEADLYWTVQVAHQTAVIELLKQQIAATLEQNKVEREANQMVLAELLAARAKKADEAMNAVITGHGEDGTPYMLELLIDQKRFNAELDAATTPAERLALYQQHFRSFKHRESKCYALHLVGSKGGEDDIYFTIRLARETSEIELLKMQLQSNDPAADAKRLPGMLAARVKTAEQAMRATITGEHAETLPLVQYLYIEQRLFTAELELAQTAASRIAAYQQRVRRAQAMEQAIEPLFLSGKKDEADLYWTIQLVRQTAEIELLKAQLAADGAQKVRTKL